MDASTGVFLSYAANTLVQFADSYLTTKALVAEKTNGLKGEFNPVTRKLIDKLGVAGSTAIKVGAIPMIGFFVEYYSGYPGAFNGVMAAITAPVLLWNVYQLRKKKISIL